jgi:hypothetical protein
VRPRSASDGFSAHCRSSKALSCPRAKYLGRDAPPSLLTKSDRLIVEAAIRLIAKMGTSDYKTSDLNSPAISFGQDWVQPT